MANVKVKARVGLYVTADRYGAVEVISQEQYDEKVAKKADEYYRDERQFIDYLDDTYNTEEIWDMTDKEKKEVKEKDFKEQCKEWAKDDLTDEWNYQEIETEVELPTACPCRQ